MTEEELRYIRIEALTLAVYTLDVALSSAAFDAADDSPISIEQGLVGAAKTFENYIVNGYNNTSSKS